MTDSIEFYCSSPSLKECPKPEIPEFAFIGRSNVGKSSLINLLANRKGLAKTSGTPGKTRLINFFMVNPPALSPASPQQKEPSLQYSWFLVDLPGYGFAKISKEQRSAFEGIIRNYLEKRETLAMTFVLVDSRLEPQKSDIGFINWLGEHEIPFVLLFTKTDKLTKQELSVRLQSYKKTLSGFWDELPNIIPVSAVTRSGRDVVLKTIENILKEIRLG